MKTAGLAILLLTVGVLTQTGCGARNSTSGKTATLFAEPPLLPNPRAGSYARVIQEPRDPVVAQVVEGKKWDASLAGAAAGLALPALDSDGGFSRREIREAAWQAGYPYPISHIAVWKTEPKNPPPKDIQVWLNEIDPAMDIGLVRSRNAKQELWVGLAAIPKIDLGVIPREIPIQTPLKLPAIPNAQLQVVGPTGSLKTQPLTQEVTLHLDHEGEWLLSFTTPDRDLARFTVYVGVDAPTDPVIYGPSESVGDDQMAITRAKALISQARQTYGMTPWLVDPYLQSTALKSMESQDKNTLSVTSLGLAETTHRLWTCKGRTVEDCVDQMIWIPGYRATLLSPHFKYAGISGAIVEQGIELHVLISRD